MDLRQGFAVFPFLWAEEAQQDMAATTRSPVPIDQILEMHVQSCTQLGLPDPGELGFAKA